MYERNGSCAKYVTPEGRHVNLVRDLLHSFFYESQKIEFISYIYGYETYYREVPRTVKSCVLAS